MKVLICLLFGMLNNHDFSHLYLCSCLWIGGLRYCQWWNCVHYDIEIASVSHLTASSSLASIFSHGSHFLSIICCHGNWFLNQTMLLVILSAANMYGSSLVWVVSWFCYVFKIFVLKINGKPYFEEIWFLIKQNLFEILISIISLSLYEFEDFYFLKQITEIWIR